MRKIAKSPLFIRKKEVWKNITKILTFIFRLLSIGTMTSTVIKMNENSLYKYNTVGKYNGNLQWKENLASESKHSPIAIVLVFIIKSTLT